MSTKIKQLVAVILINTLSLSYVSAQGGASISMGAGYANDVYYSLSDGVVATVPNNDWDVAFTTDLFDATVRVNAAAGIEVFLASADLTDWSTLDTTGIFDSPLYNSDASWTVGAFNQQSSGSFNYGWGTYNTTTHNVLGTRIYVLRYPDGSHRKFAIEQMLASGTYTFKYADLDGSNETQGTLSKTAYSGKPFVAYSFASNSVVDREPASGTWDLLFTKYFAAVAPGVYYPVTGVLTAPGVATAIRTGLPVLDDSYASLSFEDSLGAIGYNWKAFNMTTFSYDIADSVVYFVRNANFGIQKLYFTGFDGSATGNVDFNVGEVLNVSVEEAATSGLNIYPNPVSDRLWINMEDAAGGAIQLVNASGRVVANWKGDFSGRALDVSGIAPGFYTIVYRDDRTNQSIRQPLIIK